MRNFNLGNLSSWKQVAVGEMLDFPVPRNKYRAVEFDLLADSHVTVAAVTGDDATLIAAGDGQMSIKFTTQRSVAVVVQGDPNAEVFIRTKLETQVIPESLDPSYTSIEPRPAGPSAELRQMMAIQKLNEKRRTDALMKRLADLEREKRQPAPQVIEPDPPRSPEAQQHAEENGNDG